MKSYKAAPTNVKKNKVAGHFKHNNRNKPGSGGSPNKDVKEKLAHKDAVHAKLSKISKAMFGKKTVKDTQVSMRAQLNG